MAFREITGTAKALATLPAGGVYESSPTTIVCNQYERISFKIAYTRGGAGGAVTYKIEFSDDAGSVTSPTWFQVAEIQAPAIVAGSDIVDLTQRAEIKYQATGATVERFMSPTFVVSGLFCRVVMKESGAVGTPGTVSALFYMQGAN